MAPIRQMTYRAPDESTGPVEVMSFDRLRTLDTGHTQRGDFHVVALITAGHGAVTVDFAAGALGPRTVVWLAPGVVHRWDDIAEVHGDLVLFTATVPVTPATRAAAAAPRRVAWWTAPAPDWPYLIAAMAHLRLEAGTDSPPETTAILTSALINRIDPPDIALGRSHDVFGAFCAAVETQFRQHHDAGFYAAALGYSARTLSRAVQRATGRTAKAYLAERLALEAKRLLAHEGFTAARCAAHLGFADASSFSAFFGRHVGQTPGAWQRRSRSYPAASSRAVRTPST